MGWEASRYGLLLAAYENLARCAGVMEQALRDLAEDMDAAGRFAQGVVDEVEQMRATEYAA